MPIALPTITGATPSTLKIVFTKSLGGFVGRLVPGVGWVVLAYDVVQIIDRTARKYNLIAREADRLW